MVSRVQVVGRGRVGSAFAARLAEHRLLVENEPDLVLLCVPDRAIAEVAATIAAGPWVAHTSGATPLAYLAPHQKRFSLHPLQTFSSARGPDQIDGAWGAVTAEAPDGLGVGRWLASTLGLRPFELKDESRVLYHAGAVFASNYLVTLYRAASRAVLTAGVPAEALVPLMQRTIENGFELTGPIARGDWATVDAHIAVLERQWPELADLYRVLARATRS
jgi:predicted short-subunit dehydrogenase-like oxidoreductase (DUF2520 family)